MAGAISTAPPLARTTRAYCRWHPDGGGRSTVTSSKSPYCPSIGLWAISWNTTPVGAWFIAIPFPCCWCAIPRMTDHRLLSSVRRLLAPRLQLLSLFEVPVGLSRRNRAVLRQSLDRIGKSIDLPNHDPCAIEALSLLDIAGARGNAMVEVTRARPPVPAGRLSATAGRCKNPGAPVAPQLPMGYSES